MSDSPQVPKLLFKISRRRFNRLITLTTVGVLANEIAFPAIAYAEECGSSKVATNQELYHIFIGKELAQRGGKQTVTLKSGNIQTITIPRGSTEKTEIPLRHAALNGKDALIVLHTLYDPFIDIDGLIEQAIASVPLLPATHDRCRDVYQQVKNGERVEDMQALDVLDAIVSGSSKVRKAKDGSCIQQRYQIASQNSRLVELQTYLEEAIAQSEISSEQKQKLRGIYQYVRANEALPNDDNLDILTVLDALVQGSNLPVPVRQRYAFASAQTRAFTADIAIQNLIRANYTTTETAKPYLETYNQVRLGKTVKDEIILIALDELVNRSNLSPEAKAIYRLARDRFFDQHESGEQQVQDDLERYLKAGRQAARRGAEIVPTMTEVFAAGGVTAGTGTAISALSGGAAVNATLAALGGGSVAAGGLGMLGGLAIATGGAALSGAAAVVSVSLVAGMSSQELSKLGVAATAGTLASAVVMGTAWAVASTFLISTSLSGAAAISAVMATLGGVTGITGGAALIAFGVGLGVWHFIRNNDAALEKTLRHTEPTLYLVAESEEANFPTITILNEYLNPFEKESDEAYVATQIPLEKLSNALSNYACLDRDDKVLALVDTSFWDNGKAGITFTARGIWWNDVSSHGFADYADPDYIFKIKDLPGSVSDAEEKKVFELALKLGEEASSKAKVL